MHFIMSQNMSCTLPRSIHATIAQKLVLWTTNMVKKKFSGGGVFDLAVGQPQRFSKDTKTKKNELVSCRD